MELLNCCHYVVAICYLTARHDLIRSTGQDWLKESHSDSCLINITDLTVMIFWQKRENPTVHILFSFFTSSSHTPNCQTLCENTSNFKCTKMRLHPKTYCSYLLVGEIWRDSWSSCCLSHYKWIPSLRQMSETRWGKTPVSPQSTQVFWMFPSPPVSPHSCLSLEGSITQLFF